MQEGRAVVRILYVCKKKEFKHDRRHTVHVTSLLQNLADLPRRFSANLRAAKCGCPSTFHGIIAGYPRNHRWLSAEPSLSIRGTSVGHPRNVPLKVCAERSKEKD